MRRSFTAPAVIALALTLAACSSSGGTSSKMGAHGTSTSATTTALHGSITVDAAASLTGAFNTLKASFMKVHPGTTVTTAYGPSSGLATQIVQGAPVDVFASAAPKNMQTVVTAGQASDPANFVSNSGEIAVPAGNPGKVASVHDLAKPGVTVAVCAPAVPCGVIATQVFAKAKIKVTPKASLADVKTTLAAVESGNVDAGIVYLTDVKAAGAKVKGVPIPTSLNATTEYPIAALTHSKNPSLAREWVAYVRSAAGQQVLRSDGFAAP